MNYTPEQQKENRKKWVAALRSGKYEQTGKALHKKDDGYCCLGVACEISGLGAWVQDSEYDREILRYVTPVDYHSSTLPPSVANWLGLRDVAGIFRQFDGAYGVKVEKWLTELNDNGISFVEIADVIEQEPEGLVE